MCRTKIVATIGSPTSYREGLYRLDLTEVPTGEITYPFLVSNFLEQGANIIRFNLAHIKKEEDRHLIREFFDAVRAAAEDRCDVAVLADLEGPKIRLHTFEDKDVTADEVRGLTSFVVDFATPEPAAKNTATVYVDKHPLNDLHPDVVNEIVAATVQKGAQIFVGDGEVVLRAAARQTLAGVIRTRKLECEFVRKDVIGKDKGFTVRDLDFNIPTYTETDQRKLGWLLEEAYRKEPHVLAFIGLSFAWRPEDVDRLRFDILKQCQRPDCGAEQYGDDVLPEDLRPMVIAKIETREGSIQAGHIAAAADGVMVARGDMGVQMDPEKVPEIQRELLRMCRHWGKPVITATQMLLSMTKNVEPTRAEVNDVFQAILDGSDAVMLSDETSKGRYPFHSIRTMKRIAVEAETYYHDPRPPRQIKEIAGSPGGAVGQPRLPDDRRKTAACEAAIRRHERFLEGQKAFGEDYSQILEAGLRSARTRISECRTGTDPDASARWKWVKGRYEREYEFWERQPITDRVSQAACCIAEQEHAGLSGDGSCDIVAATTTGRAARMIARFRPTVRVVGAAHDELNARKLALSYGVIPVCLGHMKSAQAGPSEMFDEASGPVAKVLQGSKRPNVQMVVFVSGTHPEHPGTTNTIQLRRLEPS